MLVQIVTENGQKKVIPLTADAGAGAPVGTIIAMYKKSNPSGFLYLDGRDTTGTSEELSTHYPILYAILGSNKLPDYREFALVGAEENTTDVYNASTNPTGTIHDHDVYTEGQAKDDQLQEHAHTISANNSPTLKSAPYGNNGGNTYVGTESAILSNVIYANTISTGRYGDVTRGKRKAVYFYIKATSGLSENAQDNVLATINEERSYSTEEVNTGKKWIDGKPIYRKVIVDDTPTNNEVIATNVDNLISQGGYLLWANTTKYNIPWITSSGYSVNCKLESNTVYLNIANTGSYLNKVRAILEYTKTT